MAIDTFTSTVAARSFQDCVLLWTTIIVRLGVLAKEPFYVWEELLML
jgi:hypothetical protein